MTIEEFTSVVSQRLRSFLPEGFEEARIDVYNTIKNSKRVHGICIRLKGQNVAPVFYMENYYEEGTEEVTDDIIMSLVKDIEPYYKDYLEGKDAKAVEEELLKFKIDNYEFVKSYLRPIVVNSRYYSELLKNFDYKIINDMAVLLIIEIPQSVFKYGPSCVKVSREIQSLWNISFDELLKTAIDNLNPDKFILRDVSCHFSGDKEINLLKEIEINDRNTLFELTSKETMYGACGILCDSVMNKICSLFPEGYYIIPSSVHECLIISENISECPERLKEQLTSINLNENLITSDDVLSFDIYRYDKEQNELLAV